jgi:peptidoglycan/LPS O-acetylase OafA/YrhL
MRRRMTRSTGAVSGLLIILLGVWGALIPFVGPYFNYSFGANTTWHYTTDRLWLDILPGALAVLAGIMLLLAATRAAGMLAGWLAMVAGAWFVVGPSVSLTWESGAGPIGRPLYGSTRQMLELVGYFYGLGALIVALAAFAVGRFASRPPLAEEAAIAGPAGRTEPAPPGPPAAARAAGAEDGRGRRFPLRGRGERAEGERPGSRLGR